MVTTIQLNENVKAELDRLKTNKETYEQVIIKMVRELEEQRRKKIDLMIEGAKETAEESLRITQEWEATDANLDWECEGLIPKKYLKDIKLN